MTREEQAKLEIGRTDISRGQALTLTAAFLVLIGSVPLLQHVRGWQEWRRTDEAVSLSFYRHAAGVGPALRREWRRAERPIDRILRPNAELLRRINAFEDELDERDLLSRATQAPVQAMLCRLGAGNEEAYVGRDGWLFFAPSVRYVTGPGFLDPARLRARLLEGGETARAPQPDPVDGIVHVRDQLREHGIALLVVPTPAKPTIHPEAFTARLSPADAPVENRSYGQFIERLREEGVAVLDLSAALAARARDDGPQYLKRDTHWTPQAMMAAAAMIARAVEDTGRLAPAPDARRYVSEPDAAAAGGDIAAMLALSPGQTLYPTESVTIHRVRDADGRPWAPDPQAEVLLLGDSFTNIYALEELGWGSGAGLAEHLSLALNRPVDRLARNDAGAFATRERLAVELGRGQRQLDRVRIVVWQFAARELAAGDWRAIPLARGVATPPAPADPVTAGDAVAAVAVEGVVEAVSTRPQTDTVYRDFVMKLYLTDMTSTATGTPHGTGDGVVNVMAMRDRVILPIATVQPGERIALHVKPWDHVAARYDAIKAGSLDDIMLELEQDLYWGEPF